MATNRRFVKAIVIWILTSFQNESLWAHFSLSLGSILFIIFIVSICTIFYDNDAVPVDLWTAVSSSMFLNSFISQLLLQQSTNLPCIVSISEGKYCRKYRTPPSPFTL